jgi:hypothetical protein
MKRSILLAVLVAGCSSTENLKDHDESIVGGNLDKRDPAVGYLVARITVGPNAGKLVAPVCGAVLVGERAVLTSAGCVEEEERTNDRTIVGVGFGEAPTTAGMFEVDGTWKDWIHPSYLKTSSEPPVTVRDWRYEVAIVSLKTVVPGIAPMRINEAPILPKSRARIIGYGRVVEGPLGPSDNVPGMLGDSTRYPGVRKSAELEISVVKNTIDAHPLPDTPSRASGGLCIGDFGGPLILEDGSVGGIARTLAQEVINEMVFDQRPLCRPDAGGEYVNLRFGKNPEFVRAKLAAQSPR